MSEPVESRRWTIADGYSGYPDVVLEGGGPGSKRAAAAGATLVADAAALA